jgi:hypothetical protein
MPRRWGSSGTRYHKTTTTRRGNVTYRTTKSRGPWGGSYAPPSKAEEKFFRWFFGLLLAFAVVFWPLGLHGAARPIVSVLWFAVCLLVLVGRYRSKSKKRAAVKTVAAPKPTAGAPKSNVPPQDAELHQTVERLTREVEAAKTALQKLQAEQGKSPGQT